LLANATTGQLHHKKRGPSTGVAGSDRTMPVKSILLAVSSEISIESCFFRKGSIILAIGFDGK
jgi:hypothetical protein